MLRFRKFLVPFAMLSVSSLMFADGGQSASIKECKHLGEVSRFHAIVASGYAWSMKTDIHVDEAQWAPADEGYSANLGNSPFIQLGFGCRLWKVLDLDFNYTLYDSFQYYKDQTDPFGNKRSRSFTLDHQGSIFSATYFPYAFRFCKIQCTPFLGMGIGIGTSKVSDFQTVFYDPVQGIGLTTSTGAPHVRNSFAWQGGGGFRIHPMSSKLSLDLAYRYYNGGTFEGPSQVTDYNGSDFGEVDKVQPWTGTLQTNQFYFAVNFSL